MIERKAAHRRAVATSTPPPTTQARNQGSKSRRAAPDRPMGGRFLTVLRLNIPTPKIRNKVAPTDLPLPTRGRALPSVARSLRPQTCRSLRTTSRFGERTKLPFEMEHQAAHRRAEVRRSNRSDCHFMAAKHIRPNRHAQQQPNRRAVGRPGDARRPAALSRAGTCGDEQ